MICFGLFVIFGCVSESFAPPLDDCTDPGLIATKTISDMYAIAINPSGTPANSPVYVNNAATDIIEGYVVSSDEGGNFYQSMYIQPLDKSKGFNISVDIKSAYIKKLQPGKKIFLKINGLAFANPTNFASGLIFGAKPTDRFAVNRLTSYENFIFPTCDVVNEDLLVNKITIAEAKADDKYLNTLVEFDNVQFSNDSAGGTFDPNINDESDGNAILTDNNVEIPVRTSRFSNFSGFATPILNGTIRGVLTKFSGSYQLILRTERDVNMKNPRKLTPSNPLGGNAIIFNDKLNEPFTSYSVATENFPTYVNDKLLGNRYWNVKEFSNNKYLDLGAFASGGAVKSYFMVPVNFTAANSFKFKKKARFFFGAPLKIYYTKTSDYVPGFLNTLLMKNITSKFNLVYPEISLSESNFTSSGVYNIPSDLQGDGYFVFEYNGSSSGITTTIQIDDIVIN